MSKMDDKADSTLSQTQLIKQQLDKLDDQLHNLLACYQFYDHAIRAMTNPEQLEDTEDWYFGLFLNQQWLRQQGEALMAELLATKQLING